MSILVLIFKLRDVVDFVVVLALYTLSHCAEGMFDEIAEEDLPDALCSDYRAVR